MQGAEPFYYPGGDIGCLCLHGLTASPAEVAWLGAFLAEQKVTVYGPRCAGHGVDYQQLRHLRWQDWYLSALDGYHLLRSQCQKVVVAGLSMGGLLALLLGASVPVDGLVAMAAPVIFQKPFQMNTARWLKRVRPFLDMPDHSNFPQWLVEEQKRRGEQPAGRVRYDTWATQAVEELKKLGDLVDTQLPEITAPTLLMYSEGDTTVPLINRDHLKSRLGSESISTHTLSKSDHILVQDVEYQDVLHQIGQFIRNME
jgi:carboxylesterase